MSTNNVNHSAYKSRRLLGLFLGVICSFMPAVAFFGFGKTAVIAVAIVSLIVLIANLRFFKSKIGFIGGLIGLIFAAGFLAFIIAQEGASLPVSSLDQAEKQLFMASDGGFAFGNHEQAKIIAETLCAQLDGFLSGSEIGEKPTGMSMNGENVATYLSLQPNSVVALMTVPRFKKYSDKGKQAIYTKAWQLATNALKENRQVKSDATLAIAIRSGISYSAIHYGEITKAAPTTTDGTEDRLASLFGAEGE